MTRAFILVMTGAVMFGLFLIALCDITFRVCWRFRKPVRRNTPAPAAKFGWFGDVPAAADVVDEAAAIKALERTFTAHERATARLLNAGLRKLPQVKR